MRVKDMQTCSTFQFTPLREGRHAFVMPIQIAPYFNSRPSARGDTRRLLINSNRNYFNSRPSARGDILPVARTSFLAFQFTPLREGRLAFSVASSRTDIFQFTPLHEGRLNLLILLVRHHISIHAPPRGATCGCFRVLQSRFAISIHAPPRGATRAQEEGGNAG